METWSHVLSVIEPVLHNYPEFVVAEPLIRTGTGWECRIEIGEPHHSAVVLGDTFNENIYADLVQALQHAGFGIESTVTDPDGSFVVRLDTRPSHERN
jgi:hypothetical protein